jgi:hypothetical protein
MFSEMPADLLMFPVDGRKDDDLGSADARMMTILSADRPWSSKLKGSLNGL